MTEKKQHGGHNKRVDTVRVTTTVEREVRDKAKLNHKTISNAIRFAAENKAK